MATPRAAEHTDLTRVIADLKAQIRELTTKVLQRPKFKVSEGDLTIEGGALVVDGGDFLLLDTDGSTVFRLGPQTHGDRGVSIYRETGEQALGVRKPLSGSTRQTVALWDVNGYQLVAEEAVGNGPAYPIVNIPMQPVAATSTAIQAGPHGLESVVSSGTWTSTHAARFARSNQYGRLRVMVKPSDATTAGEVQVINVTTGASLAALASPAWVGGVAAGGTAYVEVASPGLVIPGNPWSSVNIAVQVRRTAGTGSLTAAVPVARGTDANGLV